MSLSDTMKTTLMTKFGLDETSLIVISNIIEKNQFSIVDVEGDLYVKSQDRPNLQKIDIETGRHISYWINTLKNIQGGDFTCSHPNLKCCCKDDGIIVGGTVNNGLLLHYLYEKINILENEVKQLRSLTPIEKVDKPPQIENHVSNIQKKPFTSERIRYECIELSKKYEIPFRLFDFTKRMSYLLHWSGTLEDPIRMSLDELKNLKDPRSIRKIGLLLFEKDNILIYANISKYNTMKEIQDHLIELFP